MTAVTQLTPADEVEIVYLYRKGWNIRNLSVKYHVGQKRVAKILRAHGVRFVCKIRGDYIPTPQEIEEAAERIREGWDEDELKRRAVGIVDVPVEIPQLPRVEIGYHGAGRLYL